MDIADTEDVIGVFIGLQSSSYEYIANIIAPYRTNFSVDLGNFLIIYDSPQKLVARVIDFVPQGELTSFMGQKWLSDVAFETEAIGSDIKKRKISYSVKIKILGALDEKNRFVAGLRRIPHITSKVVKPDSNLVKEIINQVLDEQKRGSEIGAYYLDQSIKVNFDLSELITKKTFVFARAGYGKSNLMKVLASQWKKEFGSLLVFDPEGEYAFTDKKGRPGIMDKSEALLITNRRENQGINNVYPSLRLNLKELPPRFVIPMLVTPEKHGNVFFAKLMSLSQIQWNDLVDLLSKQGWSAGLNDINRIMNVSGTDEATEMKPIRNNLILPISTLHDSQSHLLEAIELAVRRGSIVIVDISRIDSKTAVWLSSIIVKHIFNENQKNFIQGSADDLLKVTFVVDEAQTVISKEANVEAFVKLAKEGRKYSLGGIFITQQPSTIPFEIISQGDNFFVFHLLSRGDLESLQRANAHYSNDVITQILNEPKKGKCYMWTSSQPFVLPVQITNFEDANIANKAVEVQKKSNLLASLMGEISEKMKSPVFKSILSKYEEVERTNTGQEIGNKTILLFQKLNDEEKAYLRKEKALQVGPLDNKEFAITLPFYKKFAIFSHAEDEDDA